MPAKSRRSSNEGDLSYTQKMFMAIRKGNLSECEKIFTTDMRSDPRLLNEVNLNDDDDEEKTNCVSEACIAGHGNILEYLITIGGKTQHKSLSGMTPLHYAARTNHTDCVKICLANDVNINQQTNYGSTPLISASLRGNLEALEILLQSGADPNIVNVDGQTALILSASLDFVDCVRMLIKAGADVNIKDEFGWTAFTLAREKNCLKCVKALNESGLVASEEAPKYPIDTDFSAEKIAKMSEMQDVDEMKIQTMYKMVDECRIISQGKEVVKKVLYLSNKQAVMFDEDAMERAVQALDIGEPKFVIKLMSSTGVASQMDIAHPERKGTAETQYLKATSATSEINKHDERVVETQILLFMRTCILPLAMQTRALILVNGANDCYLSTALSKVAVAEQARLGKDCPFTVIATVSEIEVHAKAVSPDPNDNKTVAAQLARQSKTWKKRIGFMHNYYSNKLLSQRKKMQQCDLTEAASRYIIFEGFEEGADEDDDGSLNRGPQKIFESVFLQYMTRKLPSIAIQCLIPSQGVPFLVDLVSRNIPVLLLDTTERCFTINKDNRNYETLTHLADESDAFPSITLEVFNVIREDKFDDGIMSFEGKSLLLEIAQEMIERKLDCLATHCVCDSLFTSTLAFFHSVLTCGGSVGLSSLGQIPLYLRIREMEKFERTSKVLKKVNVSPEMASKVMDYIQSRLNALDVYCRLARVDHWIASHDKKMKHLLFDAIEYKKKLIEQRDEIELNSGMLMNFNLDSDTWLACYELLTSSNTYSGSIFDMDEIKRILGSVAKIDRLPTANSLEALRMLQDAWDHVEIYNLVAQSYKSVSKVTYMLMLLIGIAITLFSLANAIDLYESRIQVIILSFIGTAVASYISWTNPAIKWQQLRTAALSIESNIWTFRTRAGPYRTSGEGFDHSSEVLLSDVLKDIKEKVLEGADIKNTAFYSAVKAQNKHGQHPPGATNFGAVDNFATFSDINGLLEYDSRQSRTRQCAWIFRCLHNVMSCVYKVLCSCFGSTANSRKKAKNRHGEDKRDIESLLENSAKENSYKKSARKGKVTIAPSVEVIDISDHDDDSQDETIEKVPEIKRSELNKNSSMNKIPVSSEKTIKLADVLNYLKNDVSEVDILATDSHYEPLQPDAYIRFRVLPVIQFYKNRIPRCSRIRSITQLLLVTGTISTALLAILGLTSLASGVTIFTASITAYLEFSGTNSKIARYSFTVHALQELVYWWQTLPQIDRSVVANIDRLVLTCEELLQREQQAWRSTSQTVRMLQKLSQEESSSAATMKGAHDGN